jgi:hypothetical protein
LEEEKHSFANGSGSVLAKDRRPSNACVINIYACKGAKIVKEKKKRNCCLGLKLYKKIF